MEFNPFGRQETQLTTAQRAEVVENVEEIRSQLEASEPRYNEAFRNLREGDNGDMEYLEEMQENLVAWSQKLKEKFKTVEKIDMYDEEVLRQVNARLYELSEEFEKLESTK